MVTYPVKKQLKKFFCRGFKSFQIMAQFFKAHTKLKNFLEREIIHFIPWTQKLNKYENIINVQIQTKIVLFKEYM